MTILSIDPGITGAMAVFEDGECTGVTAMPWTWSEKNKKKKKIIDLFALDDLFRTVAPDFVVIEKVHAMPGQGVTSMFSFGFAYGVVMAMAHSHSKHVINVTPQEWKKHFDLIGKEKKEATLLAKGMCPLVTSSGKADAYLIGRWFDA